MKKLRKSLAIVTGIFTLFGLGLALRTKKNVQISEKKFPPLGKFCDIQGCSIHYFTEGKGPVIVLLHGENGDIYDFYLSPLWQKLKDKYQLVAFDRPGSGYSKRVNCKDYGFRNQGEIIHHAIQSLDLQNPLLLGYGESSGVILSILMEHEDLYKGAVLLEDKVSNVRELSDKIISIPVIGILLLWTVYPVMAGIKANKKIPENDITGEYLQKSRTFDTNPAKLINSYENKKFMKIEELEKLSSIHSGIKKPVTIIHSGSSEGTGNLTSSIKLGEIISNLNIVPIPDSVTVLTDPDRIVNEINKIG